MRLSRRHVLGIGGALLAAPITARTGWAGEGETVEIVMRGNADGSNVWFDPIGIHIRPGQSIRWINRDPGNSHTATAYHPQNFEHPLRIPRGARPWNSDYLMPEESFSVTLTVEGVYDYFCIPHEHAGMVGRIVVGHPGTPPPANEADAEALPEAALKAFPSVEDIMRRSIVHPT